MISGQRGRWRIRGLRCTNWEKWGSPLITNEASFSCAFVFLLNNFILLIRILFFRSTHSKYAWFCLFHYKVNDCNLNHHGSCAPMLCISPPCVSCRIFLFLFFKTHWLCQNDFNRVLREQCSKIYKIINICLVKKLK